jgi:hypothetical protein
MAWVLFDQGTDQAHEFLLFWPTASAEEGSDLNVLDVPTGRSIALVADKHST